MVEFLDKNVRIFPGVTHSESRLALNSQFIHPDLRRITQCESDDDDDENQDDELVDKLTTILLGEIKHDVLVFYVLAYAADPHSSWSMDFDKEPTLEDVKKSPYFECLKRGDILVDESESGDRNNGFYLWTGRDVIPFDRSDRTIPYGDYGLVPRSFTTNELGSANFYQEHVNYNRYRWFDPSGYTVRQTPPGKFSFPSIWTGGNLCLTFELTRGDSCQVEWWLVMDPKTPDLADEFLKGSLWCHNWANEYTVQFPGIPYDRLLIGALLS